MTDVRVPLVGYQRRWLADRARLRVWLKARRIGASFVVSLDHAAEVIGLDLSSGAFLPGQGVDQLLVSTGERKATDLLATARRHVKAFEAALGVPLILKDSETRLQLRNGRHVLALPGGNDAAIHGWTGSVLLDEASRIPNAEECFKAAYFVTAPTIGRPGGFRFSVVSTPNGASGVFWRLCETDTGAEWSRHRTDVHAAATDGFPIDVEAEKRRVGDPDTWAEQMECSFAAGEGALIRAQLYDGCVLPRSQFPAATGRTVGGYDVARKRDQSALVEGFVDANGILWVTSCEAARGLSWDAQKTWIRRSARGERRLAIDATGLGSQLAEEMSREIPGVRARAFSSASEREAVYAELKRRFYSDKIRIASDLRELRNAVTSIRREVTAQGNIRYVMPRTADGHADEAVALALCCSMAKAGTADVALSRVRRDVETRAESRACIQLGRWY